MLPGQVLPNNRYFQIRKWHQMPLKILSSGANHHCREEPVSATKAEGALKCLPFSTPRFLRTWRVWTIKKSSLLPPLPPSLTGLARFGCCISFHQLYNLDTWGLFQGNLGNLRYFKLIRSLRKKAKHSGGRLVLLILDLFGGLEGRREWVQKCA